MVKKINQIVEQIESLPSSAYYFPLVVQNREEQLESPLEKAIEGINIGDKNNKNSDVVYNFLGIDYFSRSLASTTLTNKKLRLGSSV